VITRSWSPASGASARACHVDMALLICASGTSPAFEQGVAADGDDQQHLVADVATMAPDGVKRFRLVEG